MRDTPFALALTVPWFFHGVNGTRGSPTGNEGVRSVPRNGFQSVRVLPFPRHLAHVRDKIRQQLRDLGLLTFLGSGSYRLS